MDSSKRKQSDTSSSGTGGGKRGSREDNKFHSNVSRTTSSPYPKTLSDFEDSSRYLGAKKYSSAKGPSSSSSSSKQPYHQSSLRSGSVVAPSLLSSSSKFKKLGTSIDSGDHLSPAERERQRLHEIKRDEARARAREQRKQELFELKRKEKVTMLVFGIVCFVTGILWIVILSIDYWYHVHGLQNLSAVTSHPRTPTPSLPNNKTNSNGSKTPAPASKSNGTEEIQHHGILLKSNGGLWRVCRTEKFEHKKDSTFCQEHGFFLSEDELEERKEIDEHVIDYLRTELSFSVMSLIILPMAVFSSFYAAKNSRYMYKRLASCLYFLLCTTVLIVIEVLITRVNYEKENITYLHPKHSTYYYGFCLYTSWIIFLIFLVTAILFLVYSRKRKGDKAVDDDDEAQIMGR